MSIPFQFIATGLLSVFFLFASSIKLTGWQQKIFQIQLAMFRKYGLNRRVMALVGAAELFGAISIWFGGSPLGFLGAMAILGTSAGAIICHLVFDTWKDGIAAMITCALVLSGGPAWSSGAATAGAGLTAGPKRFTKVSNMASPGNPPSEPARQAEQIPVRPMYCRAGRGCPRPAGDA